VLHDKPGAGSFFRNAVLKGAQDGRTAQPGCVSPCRHHEAACFRFVSGVGRQPSWCVVWGVTVPERRRHADERQVVNW